MTRREIPADVAYAAAVGRLNETDEALVLARAELVVAGRRIGELEADLERLRRAEERHWRPTDEGPAEWYCPYRGEVSHAPIDEGGTAAGGEADSPPPFSD